VEVSEQEMRTLIGQAAAQYQGQERERFLQLIQQEPMFAAQLRAPLYEDKVVDFLFSKADISDRSATREQLEADLESEEGHVHGPGCGHDHGHDHKPRKATAKKAAAKAEKPARGAVEKAEGKPKATKPVKDAAPAKAPEAKAAAKKPAAKKPAKKA
jgi:trigger factor